MTLETVLIIIFISPFALGALAVFFEGNRSVTPIIINNQSSQSVKTPVEDVEHENEFLNEFDNPLEVREDDYVPVKLKLEESPIVMEILQDIPADKEEVAKPTQYEVSEIPDALNKSIDDLFKAIDGHLDEQTTPSTSPILTGVNSNDKLSKEQVTPEVDYEEFASEPESIDQMLEHMDSEQLGAIDYNYPIGESLPISTREYMVLQEKYGAGVINKVTTTPGNGGTGDYDCMIGRVIKKHNLTVLQYGEHYIPLKGMNTHEGVFLVEGMFVKPDLFFVSNYTELAAQTASLNRVAGD